jgi:hypothetical protein
MVLIIILVLHVFYAPKIGKIIQSPSLEMEWYSGQGKPNQS